MSIVFYLRVAAFRGSVGMKWIHSLMVWESAKWFSTLATNDAQGF